MADAVRISNMPDGGSAQRVAYDLYYTLRAKMPDTAQDYPSKIKAHLDLYAECLNAVNGGYHDVSKLS